MKKLKFFDDTQTALSYAASELVATLEDDLNRMQGSEREHYSNEDRAKMRARIADLKTVSPLIENAVELRDALHTTNEAMVNVLLHLGKSMPKGDQHGRTNLTEDNAALLSKVPA